MQNLYVYLYRVAVAVFAVSLVFFVGIHSSLFGLSLGWVEGGSLLVLRAHDPADGVLLHGTIAVPGSAPTTQHTLATLSGHVAKDGAHFYQTESEAGSMLVRADESTQIVLGTIPFLGVAVGALMHPVGMMVLLGTPFVMFLFDALLIIVNRVLAIVRARRPLYA